MNLSVVDLYKYSEVEVNLGVDIFEEGKEEAVKEANEFIDDSVLLLNLKKLINDKDITSVHVFKSNDEKFLFGVEMFTNGEGYLFNIYKEGVVLVTNSDKYTGSVKVDYSNLPESFKENECKKGQVLVEFGVDSEVVCVDWK